MGQVFFTYTYTRICQECIIYNWIPSDPSENTHMITTNEMKNNDDFSMQ